MGLGSSIKKAWDAASKKSRTAAVAALLGIAGLLGAAINVLGADFAIGFINDKIAEVIGPHLPAVGQVIASYFFSFATACGAIWFAASWGYWLASRYPIPAPPVGAQPEHNENDKKRRTALNAVRVILEKLENVDRIVSSTYGNKEKTREEWLAKYRPELQANVRVLNHAGFVTPPVDELDEWQAGGLFALAKEIEPFLAKAELYLEARERAARFTIQIEEILKKQETRKT